MEVQITSRHSKASQTLQDTIAAELGKLEKYTDKIISCHVILDSENLERKVEITMNTSGHQVIGTAKAENIGKALSFAMDKVSRQLKKLNEKVKNHKASKAEFVEEDDAGLL
ncbi:Ribosome hibernation protein YhbH [Chitinispirillum alkaliphilum]|nr:Ribosome hibernation protein YhbH [Chitinispirillum alkaliphilum]